MRKILITGGAGNVAGSLSEEFVKNPENEVIIVDNLVTGSKDKLPSKEYKNWRFLNIDVNNYDEIAPVILDNQFDYIFHYAALVGVQRTLNNPLGVFNDIKGIENITKLSKMTNVKKLFYSSSSEVYGEPHEIPQNEETTPLNSRLPYAIVKNLGEAYIRAYFREFNLKYTIFRFFNTYGPRQSEDFVISKFLDLAINNKPITIYGDGSQTRTFCYIEDNISITKKILYNHLADNETLNIGSDRELSILELSRMIIDLTGSKSTIQFLPALTEGDMMRRKPDNTKMKHILAKPLVSLEEGIMRLAEYKRKHT